MCLFIKIIWQRFKKIVKNQTMTKNPDVSARIAITSSKKTYPPIKKSNYQLKLTKTCHSHRPGKIILLSIVTFLYFIKISFIENCTRE